jgi:integrase
MRGSTRRRGSSWTALWDATDPTTGKRRQKSKGGFARQKDAERFLSETLASVNAGTYVEPSKQPLGRFLLDEWLPAIRGTVRPNTHDTYERLMRVHVARRDVGAIPLRSLNGGHLNGLYAELEAAGLSVNTRRLIHSTLNRALHDCVRWDKLSRNPAKNADPPSASRTRVQAWTSGELRRFLARVREDRLYPLWRLAATTGMRRGELLGLTHQALGLDHARLRVEQQLRADMTFGPPKSRRSERTIALDPETVEALRRHVDMQTLERALAGPAYEDLDLVFCDALGRPLRPDSTSTAFLQHRKAAKIPVGSMHVLRHTAATIALTENVPLHVVAARLGDDPKTVLASYASAAAVGCGGCRRGRRRDR